MTYTDQIRNLQRGGFPLAWVQTCEPDRMVAETKAALGEKKTLAWDIQRGLTNGRSTGECAGDPLSPVKKAQGLPEHSAVLLLNYHKFLGGVEVIQELQNAVPILKAKGILLVVVAPKIEIPTELDRVFVVVEHDLPTADELGEIIEQVRQSPEEPFEIGDDLRTELLAAGRGLTAFEFENALALSFVTTGEFKPDIVLDQKTQMVKKSAMLEVYNGEESFETLGGLDSLKQFGKTSLRSTHKKARPRGILLLGVPGSGKSHFAKALGTEIGLPTLSLDIGSLFGSFVGESEGKAREALRIADAMEPCILFIDEIEKGLAGAASSHLSDGGTTSRVFGTFVTWLQDHESDVYVVATCNDITKITASNPEFARQERWDGVFFVDLPDDGEKTMIWDIWMDYYDLPDSVREDVGGVDDSNWTGAEIKSCCRLAALLGTTLGEASQNVIPIATSASEVIGGLREWAKGRCRSATYAGRYEGEKVPSITKRTRRMQK